MNLKPLLLLCLSIAFFLLSSCNQHTKTVALDADDNVAFKESFSGVSKSTYTTAIVAFKTGNWYLADALVGNSKADAANGGPAVRIRNTGKLGMDFDINGAQTVYVGYSAYAS